MNLVMIEDQHIRWAFNSKRFSNVKWQDIGIVPALEIS